MNLTSQLTLILLLLFSAPASVFAQEAPPNNRPDPILDAPLEDQSLEDLERDGFEFGKTKSLTNSSTATIVALTGGFFVHGLGHFYSGDSRTGWILLGAEVLSLAAMASAGLGMVLDGGGGTVAGFYAPLFQLGWSTFIGSWLLDIAGSMQGSEHQLEKNSRSDEGISLHLYYGFISANGNPARNVLRGAINFDWYNLSTSAETTQDVLLVTSEYRASVTSRLFRVRPQTFLSLEVLGDLYNVSETAPFWRYGAEGRIGGSVDLGHFFRQFDQVAIGAWIGAGNQWYVLAPEFGFGADFSEAFISHQAFMHLNLSREVNLKFAYGSHPAAYVPQPTRMFGTSELDLTYVTDIGTFTAKAQFGDGVAIWVGGGIDL